ncbi:putative integral membrane protein [Babesia bovis T2Bo]|uniref:Uncharacterized protein n=1 Tax=Babesia bovis TaxID=5865 RepID=A7ALZ3_BABBO|nr:putative integral membrane protein [Babesia bovis T2Bo]EDO07577.1 putative integral membrane protein [Babesia bovis T2Bo]|eukprot:XP_001611145.1 hypothetical protein [Babesia bovis T2Bo]
MAEGKKEQNFLDYAANFLKGLSLMQPLNLCLLGSSFAMQRFGYGPDAVGIFIGMCHNSMELFYLFSALGALAIFTSFQSYGEKTKNIQRYCSILVSWIIVAVNVVILKAFAWGEGNSNVVLYYWALVIANFVAGIDDMIIYDISSDNIPSYDLGASCTGIFVALLHGITIFILHKIRKDVNYWLVLTNIVVMLALSFIVAIVWSYYISTKLGDNAETPQPSSENGTSKCNGQCSFLNAYCGAFPMMAASTIGYGFIFVVYPLISPFEMVTFEHRYPIQSLCTTFQAISGISIWCLAEKADMKKKWEGNKRYYYLLYLLLIPYLGIGIMFIVIMHYPLSTVAKLVHMKPLIVGFLTVFFYFSGRVVINSSTAAIDGNAKPSNGASDGKECKCKHGSTLSSVNLGINLLVLNITKYISEAYIQQFITTRNAYKPGEPWPTEGMSVTDGFLYWLFTGIEEGFVSFKESFDQNVKGKLEHTLMVVNSEL